MYPALYIGSKAVAVLIGLMKLSRAFETFHHSKLFTILEEIVSKVPTFNLFQSFLHKRS